MTSPTIPALKTGSTSAFAFLETFQTATVPRLVSIPLCEPRRANVQTKMVRLPSCDAVYLQTFPRIHDQWIGEGQFAVAVPLYAEKGARVAGHLDPVPVIAVVQGPAVCRVVDSENARVVVFHFFERPPVRAAWPAFQPGVRLFSVHASPWALLEPMVAQGFASKPLAEIEADIQQRTALQASLFATLDLCFAAAVEIPNGGIAARTAEHIISVMDGIIEDEMANAIYSEDIADRLGLSSRTIHGAVTRLRGMSLHRYLRLRRLWNVHQAIEKSPAEPIRDCAMRSGFWHLGQFAASYARQFGELPSQTAARAREKRERGTPGELAAKSLSE